jgi:hypothetical protein
MKNLSEDVEKKLSKYMVDSISNQSPPELVEKLVRDKRTEV